VHPACWTVQETVHWLRSKGFEEAVCQRFVEQEIAGDALLNLDVSKLKTEVGIVAYGKRVRIDSAIAECRRIARVMSSSAIQPMRHGSSSHVDLPAQQPTARARARLSSASAGNLLGSMSPPDSGNLRKAPSMPGHNKSKDKPRDLEEQSITDKSDATVGLRLWVSSLLSSGGGHGETAVSVHFWLDMWKSFIDDL
jgi:SAM domain (Sterile alpha motif)